MRQVGGGSPGQSEGWKPVGKAAIVAGILSFVGCVQINAHAVTEENLLYLEAWRAVYQAYVDGTYNGKNWFKVKDKALKAGKMYGRPRRHAMCSGHQSHTPRKPSARRYTSIGAPSLEKDVITMMTVGSPSTSRK